VQENIINASVFKKNYQVWLRKHCWKSGERMLRMTKIHMLQSTRGTTVSFYVTKGQLHKRFSNCHSDKYCLDTLNRLKRERRQNYIVSGDDIISISSSKCKAIFDTALMSK